MPVSLERIGEKRIQMAIRLFNPIQDFKADRPGAPSLQNFPVLAISSSLATRSSIGGWVLKRERTPPPLNGLTMNRWAVEGLASMGMRWDAASNFPRAFARERGWAR
jgi:hypothetical protein